MLTSLPSATPCRRPNRGRVIDVRQGDGRQQNSQRPVSERRLKRWLHARRLELIGPLQFPVDARTEVRIRCRHGEISVAKVGTLIDRRTSDACCVGFRRFGRASNGAAWTFAALLALQGTRVYKTEMPLSALIGQQSNRRGLLRADFVAYDNDLGLRQQLICEYVSSPK